MIHEIEVLELPADLQEAELLPDDWLPGLLCSRQDVLAALRRLGHDPGLGHPERVRIDLDLARFLEIQLGPEELLFRFLIRCGDSRQELDLAAALLDDLGFRALDAASPQGIFDPRVSS